ncbi:A-kinase anchor protein 11-like isoform X1 [Anguilla anguilla]|uniref:A-kinase anchor protein 11-like isoform X1 n=1 Tax=Anguilla anguilla TaxID=7936 RepID=UPI0015A8DCB4|nr:A-kinase anchor protein 11-like isoform X1 [Anguilla anguilla]
MDACARIRGVPLKTRASIRKETVQESSTLSLKNLVKSRKQLCNVVLDLPIRETVSVTEIHFVCLPSHSLGDSATLQAVAAAPGDVIELLRSLHVPSLRDEELLLLKDSKNLLEKKDSSSQNGWLKAICILRFSHTPQNSVNTTLGLLARYTAGVKYAIELQSVQKAAPDTCQSEDDDTNQSVSSIEDDFVTAFEHLEEDETTDYPSSGPYCQHNRRDVASQTVPSHRKDKSGSRVIIRSLSKKASAKKTTPPEVSVSVQSSAVGWSTGSGSQWSFYTPSSPEKGRLTSTSLTESDESNCSSPSPIIFLDEVGYQKSLRAKLDIPKIPVLKDGVEDSDSEVSEFFDSFDQFDDLEQVLENSSKAKLHKDITPTGQTQKKKLSEDRGSKYVSRGSSAKAMNPQKFDHPVLPANIRKPTPLKPGLASGTHSEVPDSPRQVRASGEENGALFSPVRSSAFSPLGEGGSLECFWKADGDTTELRKPQDLCALYKTYSDFASSMSKEILASVCGYSSPVDMNINKNLSCVCHKEFQNVSGHLMKLSDIQETVTISKSQKSQTLTDGIQKFATDLVERSLGSAFRDLQKGVSSCTTTLCHLAARLTSSVFQMAFHEIGMRRAYVLKERAVNGLAGFLVGEAMSEALKEFCIVRKQIFNNTVAQFAADLAEELVFEGIMEVCQFSYPSTPSTSCDWSFEQEEEVVSSYASDLSESVLQEAFIELSQAEVTFTTQAAISVSLDNIHYVSAEDSNPSTMTCDAATNYLELPGTSELAGAPENRCTMRKALYCMSGVASCVPVPVAGKGISQFQNPADVCHFKSSVSHTSQTSPKKSNCSELGVVTTSALDKSTATQTDLLLATAQGNRENGEMRANDEETVFANDENVYEATSSRKSNFQNFSGNMVDLIVNEAYDLMATSKVKKTVGDCAGYLSKKIGSCMPSSRQVESQDLVNEDIVKSATTHTAVQGNTDTSAPGNERLLSDNVEKVDLRTVLEKNTSGVYVMLDEHSSVSDKLTDAAYLQEKDSVTDQSSHFPSQPSCNKDARENVWQLRDAALETRPSSVKDTLEVPDIQMAGRGDRKTVPEEALSSTGRKWSGTPGTPPSTPLQQPPPMSQEKQIKQFSKKLKGKLAKEFSPATPPSTPQYQPPAGPLEAGADSEKKDFMLKLMRSLSEEACRNEDEEYGRDGRGQSRIRAGDCRPEQNLPVESDCKIMQKGALRYAERLAFHIVSMATEMDTLGLEEGGKLNDKEGKANLPVHSARFSQETLNSLWTYAGEIAGEVINDVKKMMTTSTQHGRKAWKGSQDDSAESHSQVDHRECRLNNIADQWSSDLVTSVLNLQGSGSSGLSSKFPSCESVTDEYAGYLIRVLKREGGNRELILDQYASRLAYRSIKSGLAHATRKLKQKSSPRLQSFKRFHHDGTSEVWRRPALETPFTDTQADQCTCQKARDVSSGEYIELVNFAESLAYNITCDVTRKLRLSSVRMPKSLTDSCLYKKAKPGDVPDRLIKTSCSCSFLPYMEKYKQYHSTGSLNDGTYSDSVVQVIERYARKIVDDTLEVTLATAGHPVLEDRIRMSRNLYAERACRYCTVRERPFLSSVGRHYFQEVHRKRGRGCEVSTVSCCSQARSCSLEIPKIHIDLDKREVFAEEVVSSAIEKAKRELSSTSLNADSGIGHDGASFAESLTTDIMASAISNICRAVSVSPPGRERTNTSESAVSQQLSAGEDSIGSWSNLSFEDEHPDESSSFLHLSDSNGNSSSWSSLGLEGEVCEDPLSLSPSDSNGTEDKELEAKAHLDGPPRVETRPLHPERGLLVVTTHLEEPAPDPQVSVVLQWIAASLSNLPLMQLGQSPDKELQLLPAVLQKVKEKEWRVGELLQALLRYCEEVEPGVEPDRHGGQPFFQWLLEQA